MKSPRLWTVLSLLLVITGGVAMIAGTAFGDELFDGGPPPADAGLVFLTSGIAMLGVTNDGKRAKNVDFVGGLSGLAFVLMGGFLRFNGLIYLGTAVMVVTGILLFFTRSAPDRDESAEVS